MIDDNRPDLTSALGAANHGNADAEGLLWLLTSNTAEAHWSESGVPADLWRTYRARADAAADAGTPFSLLRRFTAALWRHRAGPPVFLVDVQDANHRCLALVRTADLRVAAEVLWTRDASGGMALVDRLGQAAPTGESEA